MKKFFFTLVIVLSLIRVNAQKDTTTIVILHTNDMHGKIDNSPQIAYLVDSIRNLYKNVFLLSAGDLVTGNPIVDKFETRGYPIIDIMNQMHYDVTAIGNHEFDLKQKGLNIAMDTANFPFVCANIDASNAILNQPSPYYKLYTSDSISIGVLGLIQIEDNGYPASNVANLNGLKFSNPLKEKKVIEKYKDSTDIYLCLSHLGNNTDIALAKKYQDFDFIVGGHTHTILYQEEHIGKTTIVQAGSYFNFLGMLSFKYKDGTITSVNDTLLSIKNTNNVDTKILKLVEKYNHNPYFDKIVGTTENDITGEDELGAFITDAIIDSLDCDIALQNNGGIRVNSLIKGNITLKEIYELSPFSNIYYIYSFTPKQIKKLIKYAYNLENHNEIQIAGASIELVIDKNNKLKTIKLLDNKNQNIANKKYKVAINDYMATSYKLSFLKKPDTIKNVLDVDVLINYLKKNSPVNYHNVSRIKIVKE